ncbi:unnamed protein product, partial [Chrysoparadoxa australica]
MAPHSRRSFIGSLASISAFTMLTPFGSLVAAERGKVKITDIKTMLIQFPKSRTYTLVKVETDSGLFGIAEAYGSPGLGIVDAIHGVKEFLIGKDPLQIDRLYTGDSRNTSQLTDGSAHAQQRAISGIE